MKMEPWPHFHTLHGGGLQEQRRRTCRKNCSDSHRYFVKSPVDGDLIDPLEEKGVASVLAWPSSYLAFALKLHEG